MQARKSPPVRGRVSVWSPIRMPGNSEDDTVWLPIDSKFPLTGYETLLQAREEGDLDTIRAAEKALAVTLKKFAKDISEKYVEALYADFGVMFLPIESLYAGVCAISFGTRKYRITVTGPTTMSALLNSLQMGFAHGRPWQNGEGLENFEAVKTEFDKFSDQLDKVDKQLTTAKKSLEDLKTTNVMQRQRRRRHPRCQRKREPARLTRRP